jgi:sirohydrochlorin cobaltochelatase
VGSDPSLADVIVERAIEAGARPDDAVAVLGHGTRQDSESEKNVYAMAERVAATERFAEAGAIFLDQEPGMLGLLERFAARTVVVVPLFVAEGWHVGQTIPADLALDGPETRRGGRTVRYAQPVGTHASVANVIERLARSCCQ